MKINTDNNLTLKLDDEHMRLFLVAQNQYLAILRCIDTGPDGNDMNGKIKSYMGIITSPEDYAGIRHIMECGYKATGLDNLSAWINKWM